jgi:hypothetical protein
MRVEYSDVSTNMVKSSRRILSTITRDGELLKYNAHPAGSGNYHQPIAVVKLPQPQPSFERLAFREVQAQGTAWICNVFEVPKLRNILQKLHSVSVKGEEQSHTRYPLTPAIASKEVDLYWFLMSNRKQISTPSRDFMLESHHYKTQQIRDCGRHALCA